MTDTDRRTAEAFASSWNTVREGSVYSRDQFLEWMAPISPDFVAGLSVLELGFGNGSLLAHMGTLEPKSLTGIELGDTVEATRRNLAHLPAGLVELRRGDLVTADLGAFDLVYCIGVLHHLADPDAGFRSLLRHTRPGGRFHAWVYAREGNALVRLVVEPIRRVASRLPWWMTKYGLALPLVVPFFLYARLLRALARRLVRPGGSRAGPPARGLRPLDREAAVLVLPSRRVRPARHSPDDLLRPPDGRTLARLARR